MAIISKIPAIVDDIVKHTENIVSYSFLPQKRLPKFKPGQFLHLATEAYDPSSEWPDSRVFSIMSSPNNSKRIKIIISKKGNFTAHIINNLKIGDEVWLKLPYGDFTFENHDENIVLIAGGTGISPFICFLEDSLDKIQNKHIKLYYGVKNSQSVIFNKELIKYQNDIKNFLCDLFIENDEEFSGFSFYKGIIDIDLILNENNSPSTCYYLSGPIEMIKAFKIKLIENNIPINKIIIDSWE